MKVPVEKNGALGKTKSSLAADFNTPPVSALCV